MTFIFGLLQNFVILCLIVPLLGVLYRVYYTEHYYSICHFPSVNYYKLYFGCYRTLLYNILITIIFYFTISAQSLENRLEFFLVCLGWEANPEAVFLVVCDPSMNEL